MVASLTLLPALLGFAGDRIEVTRWRGLIAAGFVAVAPHRRRPRDPAPLVVIGFRWRSSCCVASFVVSPLRKPRCPQRAPKPLRETFAYRWSRVIQHRPWPRRDRRPRSCSWSWRCRCSACGSGFSDEGNYPEDTTTRQAYDLLAEGFGPGFNGPLVPGRPRCPPGTDPAALRPVTDAIAADPGVAFVIARDRQRRRPSADRRAVAGHPRRPPRRTTRPPTSSTTCATTCSRAPPPAPASTSPSPGSVAVNIDFSDYLSARLPYFFAAVLALSFLLLMVVFRSLLVPLKAVIMNLLSIGAAYGVVVAVFQWGWGGGLARHRRRRRSSRSSR